MRLPSKILSAAVCLCAAAAAAHDFKVVRDVVYSPAAGAAGVGDLYLPDGFAADDPVVLCIHGGGWTGGDRESFRGVAEFFARDLKLPAFNVEYRLAPAHRWPACKDDCVAAARFLLGKGLAPYGLRPEHVFVCGASAGGHLALWTGLSLGQNAVKGVISISGIGDPKPDCALHPGRYSVLLGAGFESRLDEVDARRLIRPGAGTRFLLTHAGEDTVVPLDSAVVFADALRAADHPVETFVYSRRDEPNTGGHVIWRPASHPHRLLALLERRIAAFVGANRFEGLRSDADTFGVGAFLQWARQAPNSSVGGKELYEIVPPALAERPAGGLDGAATPLERITAANAVRVGAAKAWSGAGWRGERVTAAFVLWSGEDVAEVRLRAEGLTAADGAAIPASSLRARFVRLTTANRRAAADILDDAESLSVAAGTYRPVWLTVTVPRDARPGTYCGMLAAVGLRGARVEFPLTFEVLPKTLPPAKEWKYVLDLWQHPWAVARYHHVRPFSSAHFELMRPIWTELAEGGGKVLTATISDIPWQHQNFDAYRSMVRRTRKADGSWSFDYSDFDAYVSFGKSCGVGPYLHCYTMCPWQNRVSWTDEAAGGTVWTNLVSGSRAHADFWAPFLVDFAAHLKAKGWLDTASIALDERSPEETRANSDLIAKYAPGLKLQMAGNTLPSRYRGIAIGSFAQIMNHVDAPFRAEAAERRARGEITTYYICCMPSRPNTYVESGCGESVWAGLYPAAAGLDGLLRWCWTNWPEDPFKSADFGHTTPGDQFMIYPGPRSSVRWEMLRDGIEEAEKIRLLREAGADMSGVDAALAPLRGEKLHDRDSGTYAREADAVRAAVEAASRQGGI